MPAKRVLKLRDINNVHTYIYTCSHYVCLYKITINRYIYTCTVYNNGIVEYQTKNIGTVTNVSQSTIIV